MNTQSMRRIRTTMALAIAAALAACASAPTSNSKLDEARSAYNRAAADPQLVRSAPVELRQAQEALAKSEAALRIGDDMAEVEHFAYLSRQRTEVARLAGVIAQADAAVVASRAERDRILIDARTNEAQVQRDSAERARLAAVTERDAAEAARRQAEAARLQAEASRTQADASRIQAEAARRTAQEQLAAAEAARQQAEAERARATSLEAQMAALQAKQTNRGMVLTLGDVLFDTGLATLKPGAIRTVDQLADFLKSNAERKVLVEGHTDSVGSDSFNRELSERRAQALSQALVERQVAADRIQVSGLGEFYPVADNGNAAGRQQNRRVEVIFSDANGMVKARN
jgi:outer membrane protein OmpA-like peptidoglycan-associated protein